MNRKVLIFGTSREMKNIKSSNEAERKRMDIKNLHFISQGHKERYMIRTTKWNTASYKAAIFLLSVNIDLWRQSEQYIESYSIDFSNICLKGLGTQEYALYHAAKDIYGMGSHIRLTDLLDNDLIGDDIVKLIMSALIMRRRGVNVNEY